jgi:hypothetical protein
MWECGTGELRVPVDGFNKRRVRTMASVRHLGPPLAAVYTCVLIALFLVAIGRQSRNAEVAIAPVTTSRPKLTAQDAKIALVEMFRRYAVRDPKRCRDVWGSPEPHRQLATLPIRTNSDGTSQIGIFTARLDDQNYFFWGGSNLYEGAFKWEQAGWRASDYQMTALGCIPGRGNRKWSIPACDSCSVSEKVPAVKSDACASPDS